MQSVIRRILVPLDPSIYATAAAETACKVAQVHDSEVAGLTVLDSKEIRSSLVPATGLYYPSMAEVVQAKLAHADQKLKDCRKRFQEICEQADVAHFKTAYDGMPVQRLLESAIFFDLVVVGLETSFHFETRERKGDSLVDLLDRTTTPVLAVPAHGVEKFESALITFDGSLGSARALQDFVSFAIPFDMDVTVLVAEKEPKQAEFMLDSAAEFMKSHGLSKVSLEHDERPIAEVADDDYLECFDLIVAGIHSKKFFKNFFVGSYTKSLIEKKTKPLFLSH